MDLANRNCVLEIFLHVTATTGKAWRQESFFPYNIAVYTTRAYDICDTLEMLYSKMVLGTHYERQSALLNACSNIDFNLGGQPATA